MAKLAPGLVKLPKCVLIVSLLLLYGYNSTHPDWLLGGHYFLVMTLLARYPMHVQSVFKLIVDILMDIHVMVNWQLSTRVSADPCHMTISQAQVYNSFRWHVFVKLSANQLLVLNDCRLRSIMKRPILTSSTELLEGNLRPRPWCIDVAFTPGGGGGTLGISRWGCAAGTLEPLTYIRASSAEFCYPILE